MARKRVGKMEAYMRKVRIERMLCQGYWESEIKNLLSEEWKCTKANVHKYIQDVKADWKKIDRLDPEELRPKFLKRLEMMFQQAYDAKHLKVALEIQKEINKLTAMYNQAVDEQEPIEVITISERSEAIPALNPSSKDGDHEGQS